jgi:hypothetical protein
MCVNAQRLVGLSSPLMRNAQLNPAARGTSVGGMKNRFPDDRRTTWRQRFLAIAREMEAAAPRRESIAAVQAARRKFFADRSLRGIRLGCVRAA